MSYPGFENPSSSIGNLRSEIEHKLHGKVDSHEIHSLNHKVDSLERTIRELRSEIDGLVSRLQTLEEDKLTHPQERR
jgi:predicted  nucleic acid-binding Zn-ribbon protein